MRFSFVLISFGTPIFMDDSVMVESGVALRTRRADQRLPGPRLTNGLPVRTRRIRAHTCATVSGVIASIEREHLVERAIRLAVQLDRRRAIHPRRHALERQRHLPLELALAQRDLVVGKPVVGDASQLVADRLERACAPSPAPCRRRRRASRRRRGTTGTCRPSRRAPAPRARAGRAASSCRRRAACSTSTSA